MADQQTTDLPEGTDSVIDTADNGAETAGDESGLMMREDRDLVAQTGKRSTSAGGGAGSGISDRLRSGREQLTSQAGEKARGFVTQGLERTSEALANVARMVGDTAPGIEERLGADYGDYARRAAGALENAANTIAEKNPDELIDDTRNFVRNSPGVALAGAAVVGFVVARLLKTGLSRDEAEDDRD
jgi:ElaB/YqjD/DUF883 family membrane-anchored ribosome-binding protein